MRLQDIGDFFLAYLFSPFGWFAIIVFLFLGGAIWEGMSTAKGEQQWEDYFDSAAGKRRIYLGAILAIIVLTVLIQLMTSSSHGRCSRDGRYPTDEEFIKAALVTEVQFLYGIDGSNIVKYAEYLPQLSAAYLATNPDCCRVFRKRESEVNKLSWTKWRNGVVVQIRNEESLKAFGNGTKRILGAGYSFDVGTRYVYVDNCLNGAEEFQDLIPGG